MNKIYLNLIFLNNNKKIEERKQRNSSTSHPQQRCTLLGNLNPNRKRLVTLMMLMPVLH